MLQFFRRFQKVIFSIITVVIVISFSFFGTFQAFEKSNPQEEVAFTAINGKKITKGEVDLLAHFLATDAVDQKNWGSALGPNFLNDGVLREDFLKTGLARVLFEESYPSFQQEWDTKFEREQKFQTYRHPQVPFVATEEIWNYFAKDLKEAYQRFKKATLSNAFEAKKTLYLAESNFPALKTRQVLLYQVQQNSWIHPDPKLDQHDPSLFGYHNFSDWFGRDFLKVIASFVINASIEAENRGYRVSKEEALQSLKENALTAYGVQRENPDMSFQSPEEYFRQQLRYLGVDANGASVLWQKVLLFRKLFDDLGSSIVMASDLISPVVQFAQEEVEVVTYQLPEAFKIKDFRHWQKVETYFDLLAKERGDDFVPKEWKSPNEVGAHVPELASKRFLVEMASCDLKDLATKVGLKQMWDWQVSDDGWRYLVEHFPDIAKQEEALDRFAILESLEEVTRNQVDQQSRHQIVLLHPEWKEEALTEAPLEKMTLFFYKKGDLLPTRGLKRSTKHIALLEATPLQEIVTLEEEDKTFRIRLLDRSSDWEIATFEEANREGILEKIVAEKLQSTYQWIQKNNPTSAYLKDDGSFRPLEEVQDLLAQEMFRKNLNHARRIHPGITNVDTLTSLAFQPWVESHPMKQEEVVGVQEGLEPKPATHVQLALQPMTKVWKRSSKELPIPFSQLVQTPVGVGSDVVAANPGDLYYFEVLHVSSEKDMQLLSEVVAAQRDEVSNLLKVAYMERFIQEIKEKGAWSLGQT